MSCIKLPLVFKEIIESDKHNFLLYGGRLGGKTRNVSLVGILTMLQQPYTDIVVARASYGSMADSSYAELEGAIEQFDLPENEFTLKKSPLRIVRRNNAGVIYFVGYGGSNTSRTKSIKTKHKISFIIMEETQELKDKRNLDEALASFRRNYGDDVKVIIMFNPPPQEAHWINVYKKEKEFDNDWFVKNLTYLDILPFINDFDLKEILKTKILDEEYYRWFYLGETTGGFGSVYPMFRKEKHIITEQQLNYLLSNTPIKIKALMIGGDGAVNRDSTAFVPIALLNNGQSVILDIFYHNPKDDGVLGFHQLVQDHLCRWFEMIAQKYHLGSISEFRNPLARARTQFIPICMRIDSASPDLIQECKFFMGDRVDIAPIQKPNVVQMVAVGQSAIANNNVIVVDYGGYYSYVKNKFIKKEQNILAEQISLLIWNEKQTQYDPIVPNDVCDAWTYGNYCWYSNPENIQYFNYLRVNHIQNLLISDILKK